MTSYYAVDRSRKTVLPGPSCPGKVSNDIKKEIFTRPEKQSNGKKVQRKKVQRKKSPTEKKSKVWTPVIVNIKLSLNQ